MPALSIIVPVLDEEARITTALAALKPYRERGVEIIVADGGSRDRTVELARHLADRVIVAPRGRGAQMNAGAATASGSILIFLHADTTLPRGADALLLDGLRLSSRSWGRFDVRIQGRNPLLALLSVSMNLRSRLTGIATGDQAVFVTRRAFDAAGGFPDIPLMEDIALAAELKRSGRPLCLAARVTVSGRRFEQHGTLRMILLMWRLRLSYWLGVSPEKLARLYGYAPRDP